MDPGDLVGPAPPEARKLIREKPRFFRYELHRNRHIALHKILFTLSDAFRKVDFDGNNLLPFEESAVTISLSLASMD